MPVKKICACGEDVMDLNYYIHEAQTYYPPKGDWEGVKRMIEFADRTLDKIREDCEIEVDNAKSFVSSAKKAAENRLLGELIGYSSSAIGETLWKFRACKLDPTIKLLTSKGHIEEELRRVVPEMKE